MTVRGPWYISTAAVLDYQHLRGWAGAEDGPVFDRAEQELIEAAIAAVQRAPRILDSGALQYRMGRPYRYRLIVRPAPRPEGDLPQLVGVRASHD